ncbi:hypothetical protein HYU14_03415 [Candidatus Woesearchaeota archaeon]|nr:hypothetical protein [Candidatus Woesearchaeota archaeon]
MKQSVIATIILAVLVLVALVQAFQLNGLSDALEEGKMSIGSGSGKTATGAASGGSKPAALPASVQNLPSMVGGC